MHELFTGHTRFEISDAVAEALWNLQVALVGAGQSHGVQFPAFNEGVRSVCRLLLTPSSPIALVTIPGSPPGALPGDADAVETLEMHVRVMGS